MMSIDDLMYLKIWAKLQDASASEGILSVISEIYEKQGIQKTIIAYDNYIKHKTSLNTLPSIPCSTTCECWLEDTVETVKHTNRQCWDDELQVVKNYDDDEWVAL